MKGVRLVLHPYKRIPEDAIITSSSSSSSFTTTTTTRSAPPKGHF